MGGGEAGGREMRSLITKLRFTNGSTLSLLKIAVSGGLIVILIRSISLDAFATGLQQVKLRPFLIASALSACAMVIRSVR